jgi:putative endonuclease
MDRKNWGEYGERLAEQHLLAKGHKILARNWRTRLGEADLICQAGDCLVVVEVKTKRGTSYGSPEDMITRRKREKLFKLAQLYPSKLPQQRVDVVAIVLDHLGQLVRLNHYPAIQ